MSRFAGDPDYTLRWPRDIFIEELDRLLRRGETSGRDSDWEEEVAELLRQAFSSPVPANDFRKASSPPAAGFDPNEEPF